METEIAKYLLQFGSTGVLAWVLWMNSNRFIAFHKEQVDKTQTERSKRIESVEAHTKLCEEDRQELRQQIIGILTKSPAKPTDG